MPIVNLLEARRVYAVSLKVLSPEQRTAVEKGRDADGPANLADLALARKLYQAVKQMESQIPTKLIVSRQHC